MADGSARKELFLITSYGEGEEKKNRWTRIGVGFVNKDESINIRVDEGMVLMSGQDYQLRDPSPADESGQASPTKRK